MNIIQFNSPERSSNLNEKNWLVRTNQTITFLPMVIVLFIGLIGYEWLRTELVGSWILFIALILLGRLLNPIQATIFSILIFIIVFIYILFDIQLNTFDITTKILQLFILPIAPLLLSIYYEIMSQNNQTDHLLNAYRRNLTHKLLPISTYDYTHAQVQQMLDQELIAQYGEINIEIINHELLRDMLQVDEFKFFQQKIIDILEADFELPHFSFTDARLSIIRIIMIGDHNSNKAQQITKKIKQIDLIKIKATINSHIKQKSYSENVP